MSPLHLQTFRSVIIIPCYNRKAITLACIDRLRQLGVLGEFHILVVDDASTDGTSESIAKEFPEVEVLLTPGNLYWTGAIELGMRHAYAKGASCFIWLNDDLVLAEGSLENVCSLSLEGNCIVSGQGIVNQENGTQWYYPLLFRDVRRLRMADIDKTSFELMPSDTCRGNLVSIPRSVVELIGFPDGKNIPHMAGDTDYILQATSSHFKCFTSTKDVFYEIETKRDDNKSWLLGTEPLRNIWKRSLGKRGILYPRMIITYNLRHWKIRGAFNIFHAYFHIIAISLLRTFFKRSTLIRYFASKSHAYTIYKDLESTP